MVAMKPLAGIAEKFSRRAGAAQADYQNAVNTTPPGKWEAGAAAGADNWSSGVAQAAAEGRFAAGVVGKGAKWQRKAGTVGPQRYQTGVAAAAPDFQSGFQRYYDTLASLTLSAKGPRGDPRNYGRSTQVGEALNAARRAAKMGR